ASVRYVPGRVERERLAVQPAVHDREREARARLAGPPVIHPEVARRVPRLVPDAHRRHRRHHHPLRVGHVRRHRERAACNNLELVTLWHRWLQRAPVHLFHGLASALRGPRVLPRGLRFLAPVYAPTLRAPGDPSCAPTPTGNASRPCSPTMAPHARSGEPRGCRGSTRCVPRNVQPEPSAHAAGLETQHLVERAVLDAWIVMNGASPTASIP